MNFKNASRVVGALAALCALQGVALAATVGAGTFQLAGNVYVSATADLWNLGSAASPTNNSETAVVLNTGVGQFSDITFPQVAGVKNLEAPPAGVVVPGTTFLFPDFITLPDNINIDLTSIPVATAIPVCSGAETTCRQSAASPIVLTQRTDPVTGLPTVTATLQLIGQAHFAGDTTLTMASGSLTTTFTETGLNTIAGLLASFNTNGFVEHGYAAVWTTTAVPPRIPEPASMALIGAGLLGLGVFGKKKLGKKLISR